MSVREAIDQAVSRVRTELALMVRRVLLPAPGAGVHLQAEASTEESYEDAELVQHYGFASRPPAGSEGVLLRAGGSGEGAVVIGTQARAHRPSDLAAGEAEVHGLEAANRVRCRADGDVDLVAKSGKHVHVGGSASLLLKGEPFNLAFGTFLAAMSGPASAFHTLVAAGTATLPDVLTYCDAHAQALLQLFQDRQVTPWLASIGKVS